MAKQALSITACKVDGSSGQVQVFSDQSYKLLINPAEFSHKRKICYSTKPTLGQTGNPLRFSAIAPDTIGFNVVFDGTGAVPLAGGEPPEVADQIDALSAIVSDYQGGQHQPNPVQILWGKLIFYGRLTTLALSYTLFKSSGAPLRAKASLAFMGFVSSEEGRVRANRSSPDLSHTVLVVEGDTLPLLCQRIYGDSRYYPEVAAFNGLGQFRRLVPGVQLTFPPLR